MLWKLFFGIFGPLALIGGAYFWVSHHFEAIGEKKSAAALSASNATIAGLESVISQQNTQIDGLKAAGDARVKAGQDALGATVGRQKPSLASIDAMTRSGAVVRAQDAPCVISDSLASAKGL